MPVFPLVGSTMVAPALSTPRRSASSSIATAMRSLTLPPGLSDSTLAATTAPPGLGSRFRRTIGVRPTSSSTDFAIFGTLICGTSAAPRYGARGEVAEAELVDHLRDRARDLVPELGQIVALARAPAAAALRLEGRGGSLHRSQDVSHRDVLRRPRQLVAAR